MLKGRRILVTGGTGFLGRHLVPRLMQAGAAVSCLARKPQALNNPALIQGDCLNREDVARAVKNQDIIIHMAGMLFGNRWQDYLDYNSRMAHNLAATAQNCRVIMVSSLAAAGPSATGKSETDTPEPVSAYGWSKLMAENILAGAIPDLAILRPPIIYGSGDKGLLPLFRSCGRGIGVTPGHFPVSIIHAEDCARAIVLLASGCHKEIFHINDGQIHTMADICKAMAQAQGREKIWIFKSPNWLLGLTAMSASSAGLIRQTIRHMAKREPASAPNWNMDKLRESLQNGWVSDAARIERELGFKPQVALIEGMKEAVAGYRKEGWL